MFKIINNLYDIEDKLWTNHALRFIGGHFEDILWTFTWHLMDIWRTFGGHLEDIWIIFGGHLENIWRTFGGYLEDIWRIFRGHLEGIWRTFGGYLEDIWSLEMVFSQTKLYFCCLWKCVKSINDRKLAPKNEIDVREKELRGRVESLLGGTGQTIGTLFFPQLPNFRPTTNNRTKLDQTQCS